ncbi:acyl-CoA N-acyltransferase [Pyrenochaeta sp. DS3sAY3a]|nr:acyl-CoA N-acyltransferase [Pyrenochaeta sp. DS3sAY3a]
MHVAHHTTQAPPTPPSSCPTPPPVDDRDQDHDQNPEREGEQGLGNCDFRTPALPNKTQFSTPRNGALSTPPNETQVQHIPSNQHFYSTSKPAWTLSPVTQHNAAQTLAFINAARAILYPSLSASPDTPSTLLAPGSYFLCAYASPPPPSSSPPNSPPQIIGAVGFTPYNNRFPQFETRYASRRVVEVVRLYVDPGYRRHGVGRALVARLLDAARERDVQDVYLHTHPWLPGAVAFWEKSGFEVLEREEGTLWLTTHMQRGLGE